MRVGSASNAGMSFAAITACGRTHRVNFPRQLVFSLQVPGDPGHILLTHSRPAVPKSSAW